MADCRSSMQGGRGIYADKNRRNTRCNNVQEKCLPEFPLRHEKNNITPKYNQNKSVSKQYNRESGAGHNYFKENDFTPHPEPVKDEFVNKKAQSINNLGHAKKNNGINFGSLIGDIFNGEGTTSLLSFKDKNGSLDTEKLMIAAFIFILIKEGADIKLALALAYIML